MGKFMRQSPLATLEETEEALQDILRGLPAEQRNSVLEAIENASPEETLDLLLREFDLEHGTVDAEPLKSNLVESADMDRVGRNILSQEEKDFFFNPQDTDSEQSEFDDLDHEEQAALLEPNSDIFDKVMVSPILDDARRLQYINMGILSLVFCIMLIVGWLQYDNNRKMAQNNELLRYSQEPKAVVPAEGLWSFWEKSDSDQQKVLEEKLNSALATKKEKLFSYYMLATLEFQRGNFSEGRRYMLEGMKLRDAK